MCVILWQYLESGNIQDVHKILLQLGDHLNQIKDDSYHENDEALE